MKAEIKGQREQKTFLGSLNKIIKDHPVLAIGIISGMFFTYAFFKGSLFQNRLERYIIPPWSK